jgi:diadenosine tetraphosphatase ApaH/serine/threonine PP2A family protein phosphatase
MLIQGDLDKINRFKEIEQTGLICDLLWSDPSNSNNLKWEKNKTRSCSFVFGRKHATKFLDENKIQMIIRGHEVQMNGFGYQTN